MPTNGDLKDSLSDATHLQLDQWVCQWGQQGKLCMIVAFVLSRAAQAFLFLWYYENQDLDIFISVNVRCYIHLQWNSQLETCFLGWFKKKDMGSVLYV